MKSSDKIVLAGLRFYGYHGVLAEEKKCGQWFEVDLEISGNFTQAAVSDDLGDSLDYSSIYRDVARLMEGESLNLLETLASRIADLVMAYPEVEGVLARVKKPGAPLGGPIGYAAVETKRGKTV
jgi:dihydroneopterin aldolase